MGPNMRNLSLILISLLAISLALYSIWTFVQRRDESKPIKCSNKSLAYLHINNDVVVLNGSSTTSPFLPHSPPRQGVAVYTVFCGTSNNTANVVAVPQLSLPHFFVSDNQAVGKLAASKGWTFVSMFGSPDVDEAQANMKCKLPRTLPNLYGNLDRFKHLVYVDSKRAHTLAGKHENITAEINKMHRLSVAMIFNLHNFIKGDVWEEFEVATQHQARYKVNRAEYQKYIETRLHSSSLSGSKLLCGCFSLRDMDHPMTAVIGMNWYAEILKSGIEDQISLSFVYDRYKQFIGLTDKPLGVDK